MPEYLSPGVYIEEVRGQQPIEGVGTSTGAFVGLATKGPIGKAELVANWTQFVDKFGGLTTDGYLGYAVYQFFAEGGTRCYVVRTCHYSGDPKKPDATSANGILKDAQDAATLKATASSPGKWGKTLSVKIETASDGGNLFKMIILQNSVEVESFDNLSMSEKDANNQPNENYVESRIDGISKFIFIDLATNSTKNPPKQNTTFPLDQDGVDGITGLIQSDFIGDESLQNGLHAFDPIDDINIVAIPDSPVTGNGLVKEATTYCENRRDCFFVADPPIGLKPSGVGNGTIRGFKQGLTSMYGALYYPWVIINDPLNGTRKTIPPSGAVAGSYSKTDITRGVHKAPAGTIDGALNIAVDVETLVAKGEQDSLNPEGINVIRSFPDAGLVIWGARTLASKTNPEYRYVNIRRLFIFLEESIEEATQYVVFEPNSPALWGTVKRDISAFLTTVWRSGALFGLSPEEAFFVKVDAENNPPEVRDAGRLIIDVGVAPVKPAEFVIIRFSQKTQLA
ncbi:phage tail sheath subtilisin-like domain-containing protein [candidate division KSB1 bacterium]|nr:phage tail sheath subtilisin-like domain-containing protein [candidate division KSB1 bacterium]